MAIVEWDPPKIEYWNEPRSVGGKDFKRIEGNTEYLKTQTDGLKSGAVKAGDANKLGDYAGGVNGHYPIWHEPSDTVLVSSTTQRGVNKGDGWKLVKQFWIPHPGRYQVMLEARTSINDKTEIRSNYFPNIVIRSTSWIEFIATTDAVPPGATLTIEIRITGDSTFPVGYIRNVRIAGSPTQMSNAAVLQD